MSNKGLPQTIDTSTLPDSFLEMTAYARLSVTQVGQVWAWYLKSKQPDLPAKRDGELRSKVGQIVRQNKFNLSDEEAVSEFLRLIESECAAREQALIEKVSSADFVYEVMNAPTNGAARDWVKAHLKSNQEGETDV